jgi:hypothetical protein
MEAVKPSNNADTTGQPAQSGEPGADEALSSTPADSTTPILPPEMIFSLKQEILINV